MIIAGNSYVSMFRLGDILSTTSNETVDVKWVGALRAGHFFENHPSAQEVRKLFSQTDDWKIVSMGLHDKLFTLNRGFLHNKYSETLSLMLEQYKTVFNELNQNGKLGWLVSPQLLKGLNHLLPIRIADAVKCSDEFNQILTDWCNNNDVFVINPLDKILSETGYPYDKFLQIDNIHLNTEANKYYIEEIALKTGTNLAFKKSQSLSNSLEPRTEPESFALLVAGELGLHWDQTKYPHGSRKKFEQDIISFISNRWPDDRHLHRDDEFIANKKLDSVNLVDIYTCATDLFGIQLNFDVKLKELDTVKKISDFFYKNKPLTRNDFFETLSSDNLGDEVRMSEFFFADDRIASIGDDMYSSLKQIIRLHAPDLQLSYGIVYFWFALIEAKRNNLKLALDFIKRAIDNRLAFPFVSSRANYYIKYWTEQLEDDKGINESFFKLSQQCGSTLYANIEILYVIGSYKNIQNLKTHLRKFKNLKRLFCFLELSEFLRVSKNKIKEENIEFEFFPYILNATGYPLLVVDDKESLSIAMGKNNIKCRAFQNFVEFYKLPVPDIMFFDILGTEGQFFSSCPQSFLSQVKIISIKGEQNQNIKEKLGKDFFLLDNSTDTEMLFFKNAMIYKNDSLEGVLQKKQNLIDKSIDYKINSISDELYKHGEDTLLHRDINDAIWALRMTVNLNPYHSLACHKLAMVFWKYKNINEALNFFNRAFNIDRSNRNIAKSFADFCISLGRFDQAKKIYESYLLKKPDDKEFFLEKEKIIL